MDARVLSRYFITFEGGEGSGKTTQIKRLAEFLRREGHRVTTTREPGGTPGADAVRHLVLSGAVEDLGPEIEAILFAAARADHVENLIQPALERGDVVLCDRFHDSTRVYQVVGTDLDADHGERLEKAALAGLYPNLTIVLDVPAEEGMKRAGERRGKATADRFEKDDIALQERRRKAFLKIVRDEDTRCVVIDGTRSPDDVAEEIASLVEDRLAAARLDAIGADLKTA